MRALCLSDGTPTIDAHRPDPALASGDELVRVRLAAITQDDVSGPRAFVPGRDFVGEIDPIPAPGAATRRPAPSSLAAPPPARVVGLAEAPCGVCDRCRGGIAPHCRSAQALGETRDGACADLVAIPRPALLPVPDALHDDAALFARDVAWALLVARAVEIQARPFVTVLGDSVAALVCAQVLAGRNASVRLLGERPERFSLCERWGVRHRHRAEVGRRQDQGVVVDCTGSAGSVSLACELLRPRGTLILRRPPAAPCDLSRVVSGELTVLGLRAGLLSEALDLLARGGVDTAPLVTRRVKLESVPDAVHELRAGLALTIIVEVSPGTRRPTSTIPRRAKSPLA